MGKNKNKNPIVVNQPRNMSAAVAAVRSGELSVGKAAHLYHVSKLTLRKHVRGGPIVKTNPFLADEEEKELLEWIMASKRNGFSFRQLKFLQSVHKIIRDNSRLGLFKTGLPGHDWRKRFRKTHPEVDQETSYEGCKSLIADMPPSRLFITDQTRLQYFEADEQKEKRASAMIAFSATGSIVPPIIIYPYEDNIPEEVMVTVPGSWRSSHSENGKMTSEDFYDYFVNVFNRYLEEHKIEKPVVVFVNNFSSRVTLQFSKMCKEKEIIVVALHPNSKNVSPSNGKSFHPLKAGWGLAVEEYLRQHSGTQISNLLLAPLLKNTIERHLDANRLVDGFKSTGWYPRSQTGEDSKNMMKDSDHQSWIMEGSDDGSCDSDKNK